MNSQWQSCLCDYLRGLETRSSATATSYASILTRFFSRYDPGTVTRREVENFMHSASTRGKPPAIATMNARVAAITGMYRFATSYVPEGETEALWAKANPTVGITRGKSTCSPKGLTHKELERLFAVISQHTLIGIRDRAILLFYLYSARRRSELADLVFGDIEPTTFHEQGGTREGWVYFFRGKGHKSERDSAELVPVVKESIDWYLIAGGRMETIKASDPLFTVVGREQGHGGNVRPGEVRAVTASTIAKRIAHYAREAGVHASLHTLRHTSAKFRYESGSDVREIQQLLRHRSLSITDIYLRTLVGTEDPGYSHLLEKFGPL